MHQATCETSPDIQDEFQFEVCTSLISSATMVDTASTGMHRPILNSNGRHTLYDEGKA
ncbi:hypothetical protein MKY54_07460 [Paenibacillus sp. FSL P2-0121]|uniref:hypothetical protein n=1 Tax=Paenibacillus sp. FSL P2-0121 TaxID=2921626 RepID=UPI0030D52B81